MQFQQFGEGPAILMIPGLATTARFFDVAVKNLSRDHRVILTDLPGHGSNASQPSPPSIDSAADGLHGLVQELAPVALLGWSLGATVAYRFLKKYGSECVSLLISVEQSPLLLCGKDWEHGAFGGLDATGARQLLANIEADASAFSETLVHSCFAAGSTPDPILLKALTDESQNCDSAAVRTLLADALQQDWRQGIGTDLPILLIHGARSAVYPTPVGEWLQHHWPNARLESFQHSGHMPFIEEPEGFCSLIRSELTCGQSRPDCQPHPVPCEPENP